MVRLIRVVYIVATGFSPASAARKDGTTSTIACYFKTSLLTVADIKSNVGATRKPWLPSELHTSHFCNRFRARTTAPSGPALSPNVPGTIFTRSAS